MNLPLLEREPAIKVMATLDPAIQVPAVKDTRPLKISLRMDHVPVECDFTRNKRITSG